MSGDEMIRATAEELRKFISAKAVIGEPLDLGDRVVFSIAGFGFGFGAGAGRGGNEKAGEGGGAGGGVEPVALLVVHKDVKGPGGVQIYPLKKKGQTAEVIESIGEVIPSVVERVATKISETKAAGTGQGTQPEEKTG